MTTVLLGIVVVLQLLVLASLWMSRGSKTRPGDVEALRDALVSALRAEVDKLREAQAREARMLREELTVQTTQLARASQQTLLQMGAQQREGLDVFAKQMAALTEATERRLEQLRSVVEQRLHLLQEDNNRKLEQMRQTVDEKLHATLEQRLAASFRQVSERLEAVHQGLGEMQALASSVGDLRRVLTNVKTRGTFGEVQLELLLEQLLTPDQYEKNVAVRPGSSERVEFAVKLPGREEGSEAVYLPIDCKFPLEDYQRMLDAQDVADPAAFQEASRALQMRIRSEARSIRDKYIAPPHTTDFAILYLPIEGLFAEVLRVPGLTETLQQEYRVVVAGPTTLTALLNSLQMGFRTLAIQRRSSEVWQLLGAIKTQFGAFGELLQRTQKKLQEASQSIENATKKSRTIERRLRKVEELPADEAIRVLPELAAAEEDEE
ncbi:MAG: DNA recombination protein RmuC [Thermoflavifilum sp.]|nr:DNA recombination protein RmuC [Thermoflavifilum sp.]MCL6514523.1 DNA recombination protein RmuC [Alicyclobacillus sp.]